LFVLADELTVCSTFKAVIAI